MNEYHVKCPMCEGHGQRRSYDGHVFGWRICVWCDGYGNIKMQDLDDEFNEIVNDNFWDLID